MKSGIYTAELFFVRALFPFTGGILFAYLWGTANWLEPGILLSIFLFGALIFINLFYLLFELYNFRGLTGLLCGLFLFSGGILCCLVHKQDFRKDHFAEKGYDFLKIRIDNEPQFKNGILKFRARVIKGYRKKDTGRSEQARGNILMAIYSPDSARGLSSDELTYLKYGTELIVPAKYNTVDPPANPGEFDYKAWLGAKNIYHQAFMARDQLALLNTGSGNMFIKVALRWRARQIAFYRKIIKEDEAFGVASTLILGYRSDLSADTLAIYSKTGTIHALSVSGMHVGIVYLVISWALQWIMGRQRMVILKVLIILGLVWLYTFVTGLSPSALRSAIMLSAFVIAKSFSKQSNSYNILAFAAFWLLIYDPFLIWDVGFQLSFLAVLGLIYLQPGIRNLLHFKNTILNKLWELIAISLAAQIATFPLSIYYFHQFPTYFIVSNLFIVLPITLLMYLGLVIILCRMEFLAPVFEWLIGFTNAGLKWMAELPYASIQSIWINKGELLLLSAATILLCMALKEKNKKMLFAALFFVLAFRVSGSYTILKAAHRQEIVVFNIRKHRAVAYLSGFNAVIVTDLAANSKAFNYHIQPALKFYQIKNIQIYSLK